MATDNKIKIQWYRSSICTPDKHKVIVRSFGLTKPLSGLTRRLFVGWWPRCRIF